MANSYTFSCNTTHKNIMTHKCKQIAQ